MAIIKKGVDKVGSFSIKKMYTKTIDISAVQEHIEASVAVMFFPAYTHLGYIHSLSYELIGGAVMDPQNFNECVVRGSIVELPNSNVTMASDSWDDYMEDYAPIDPNQIVSGGDAESVDITGREHVASTSHEFMRRSYTLGLPNNAYPTAENKIRYRASGRYKGHARTGQMLSIGSQKMLVVGVTMMTPEFETDKSNSAAGGYADQGELYSALLDSFPSNSEQVPPTLGGTMHTDTNKDIEDYLYRGLQHDSIAANGDLHVRLTLSGRLDIYKPTASSFVPAP